MRARALPVRPPIPHLLPLQLRSVPASPVPMHAQERRGKLRLRLRLRLLGLNPEANRASMRVRERPVKRQRQLRPRTASRPQVLSLRDGNRSCSR